MNKIIIYKQNPACNGYLKVSEMDDVLKSGCYESPLKYDNVDWLVDEVSKLENKMAFYFWNKNKDFLLTQEGEKDYKNNIICRFCDKEIISDKFRDHCNLTYKYRRPLHQSRNINVKQKQSTFLPFMFHILSNYDSHLFYKNLIDKKVIK